LDKPQFLGFPDHILAIRLTILPWFLSLVHRVVVVVVTTTTIMMMNLQDYYTILNFIYMNTGQMVYADG
jgi:hypothetical protein